jgi:hypothetical protein
VRKPYGAFFTYIPASPSSNGVITFVWHDRSSYSIAEDVSSILRSKSDTQTKVLLLKHISNFSVTRQVGTNDRSTFSPSKA